MSDEAKDDSARFDAELAAINAFLDAQPGLAAQPNRDDPDVRRIVEAMAYFSARSQAALERGMQGAVARMVSVPVADLATTLPAMGLVSVAPAIDLDGVLSLPEGTALRVQSTEHERDRGPSLFSTVLPLDVRPIELVSAQIDRSGAAPALLLKLRANAAQRGAFELGVTVRKSDAYRPSARLFDAVKRSAGAVRAVFDGAESREATVAFGVDTRRCSKLVSSPLAVARTLLQLPEQDLIVRFGLPASTRPWTALELRVELTDMWPSALSVSRSDLALFVVPMINAWADPCVPLAFDAVNDALPLRMGVARAGAELLRVTGVYDADREMRPMLALALGTQSEGWELLDRPSGAELRVRTDDPSRWPLKLVVDAHWSQPSLWRASARASAIALQKGVAKAKLNALGLVRRAQDSALRAQPSWALDVVALRSRASLAREEIIALLQGMGASGESPFASVVQCLEVGPTRTTIDAATGALVRTIPIRWNARDDETAAAAQQLQRVLAMTFDALFDGALVLETSVGAARGESPWM